MTRRILRELIIDKVAAVDRPCQEHASADIMKRDFTQAERDAAEASGAAMPGGRYPILNVSDLHNAIHAIGRGSGSHADIRAHITARAKALGATDQLPEDWSKQETSKVLKELAKALGLPDTATEADVTKAVADNIAKTATLTAELSSISAIAKMSDKHKAHMDNLPNQDAKDKFAAMSADDRDEACNKSAPDIEKALRDGDAFRTPEGIVITKAKVGEELFVVLKNQNDRVAKAEKTAAEQIEKSAVADFAKRATDLGFGADFGPTLRKAYGGDATAQGEVEKRITALQKQVETGALFKNFGNSQPDPASAAGEFAAKVAEVQKAEPKLSEAQAYTKAYTAPANRDIVKRMKEEASA